MNTFYLDHYETLSGVISEDIPDSWSDYYRIDTALFKDELAALAQPFYAVKRFYGGCGCCAVMNYSEAILKFLEEEKKVLTYKLVERFPEN